MYIIRIRTKSCQTIEMNEFTKINDESYNDFCQNKKIEMSLEGCFEYVNINTSYEFFLTNCTNILDNYNTYSNLNFLKMKSDEISTISICEKKE